MPCPITTLHSDPATEHACNTVEPALAVVQGRARGEHARRLGALGRAGIRAANMQRLILVQSGRSWSCSSRAWARCLRPHLTAVINYLLSVKGDRHCQADWHEGMTPSFPRSPPAPGPHHFQCPEPNLPPCAAVGIVLPLQCLSARAATRAAARSSGTRASDVADPDAAPPPPISPTTTAPTSSPSPPSPSPSPPHRCVESRHCRRHRRRRRRSH